MSSQGPDVSADRLTPELRAQKLSFRSSVTTLHSLKGHGDTAVVSPALTHSFSLYFISGIPVEQNSCRMGVQSAWLAVFYSSLDFCLWPLFISPLKAPSKRDLHKLNYKPRELEVHLGLEEP